MARRCIYTDCPQGSEKADAFFQFLETWPSQSNDAKERANYFSFPFFYISCAMSFLVPLLLEFITCTSLVPSCHLCSSLDEC